MSQTKQQYGPDHETVVLDPRHIYIFLFQTQHFSQLSQFLAMLILISKKSKAVSHVFSAPLFAAYRPSGIQNTTGCIKDCTFTDVPLGCLTYLPGKKILVQQFFLAEIVLQPLFFLLSSEGRKTMQCIAIVLGHIVRMDFETAFPGEQIFKFQEYFTKLFKCCIVPGSTIPVSIDCSEEGNFLLLKFVPSEKLAVQR